MALVLLHGLWTLGEILGALGTDNRGLHSEELANPWMAQMLLAGSWDAWFELRYRSFCGGCAVEGTLAVPLFAVLGPTIAAWKLVPWAFHVATVAGASALAGRLFGPAAACLAAACWLGAPHVIREQAGTGWGNHAEVMALVFGALLLLSHERRPRWILGALLLGAAFWFARTAALALPAAWWLLGRASGAVDRPADRRRPLLAGVGLALGLLPFALDAAFLSPSASPLRTVGSPSELLQAARELIAWLFASDLARWFWGSPAAPLSWLARGHGLLLLALAMAGAWLLVARPRAPLAPLPWWLLGGWAAGMLLLHDSWGDLALVRPLQAFELRYLFPLFAILTVAVAGVISTPAPLWLRRAAWLLPLLGVVLRLDAWAPPRLDRLAEALPAGEGRDPRFERVPLTEAVALLASRRADPPAIRRRHVQVLVRRQVEVAHDRLEDQGVAGGLDREQAHRFRLGHTSGAEPEGLERLEARAGQPVEFPEIVALLETLDDAAEREVAWSELLRGCPARSPLGGTEAPARIEHLREMLSPALRAELDRRLPDYFVQPPV